MRGRKLNQVTLALALLTALGACHSATKTVGGAVSGATNIAAAPVNRLRTVNVRTETIWTYEDAKVKCPKVAEKHQGKWNGKWKLIQSGQASTCGVIGGFTN